MSFKPKLVLYFDVNKTIVMSDIAAGKSLPEILTSVICDTAWGTIDSSKVWHAAHPELTYDNPGLSKGFITYYTYLKDISGLDKKSRDQKVACFTEKGHPGEQWRSTFETLERSMRIPNSDKHYFMLPSFFEMINWLVDQQREFNLFFRTMGNDLPEIMKEFNHFCQGKHPLFPNVRYDGSDPSKPNLVMKETDLGGYHRFGKSQNDTSLLVGSLASGFSSPQDIDEHCKSHTHCVHHHSFTGIDKAIHDIFKQAKVFALRDDYHFWNKNQEHYSTGKLMLLDPHDSSTHHIFFDDNLWMHELEHHNQLIVDIRHAKTGEPLDPKPYFNVYLSQAQPLYAVRDSKYFIDRITQCEKKRQNH